MAVPPSALRHLMAGLRLEWSRQVQPPLLGLLAALLAGLGVALGIHESFANPFGPLDVAMFLTLPTALWGWQATTAASSPGARELLAARAADEWVIHLARVLLVGVMGGLLSLLFTMSALLPVRATPLAWLPALRWVPHVLLSHIASAALGGTAGLVFSRFPAVGLFAAGGLWSLLVWATVLLGPTSPDPLLRVLGWSSLLRDGEAEPLYSVLALGFVSLTLTAMLAGFAGFALLKRGRLAPAVASPARLATWALSALAFTAGAVTAGWQVRATEAVLAGPPPSGSASELVWLPEERSLLLTGPAGERRIQGPVRPTAVALSEQRFQPYIGRHGAALPLHLLTGTGPYALSVALPEGWVLYGCGETAALPDGTVACRGEQAEDDWMVPLPSGAVEAASAELRALNPQLAEARALFEMLLAAGLRELGEPMPDVIYLDPGGPRWLSPRLVSGQVRSAPDPAVSQRQMAHAAALALTQHLSDQPSGGNEGALLPLLATIDRLVWELGLLPADLMRPANLRLPAEELDAYNRWWHAVDQQLSAGHVEAASIWAALATLEVPADALRWPETAARLLAVASEEE